MKALKITKITLTFFKKNRKKEWCGRSPNLRQVGSPPDPVVGQVGTQRESPN
jgi:hypothetical protein